MGTWARRSTYARSCSAGSSTTLRWSGPSRQPSERGAEAQRRTHSPSTCLPGRVSRVSCLRSYTYSSLQRSTHGYLKGAALSLFLFFEPVFLGKKKKKKKKKKKS